MAGIIEQSDKRHPSHPAYKKASADVTEKPVKVPEEKSEKPVKVPERKTETNK